MPAIFLIGQFLKLDSRVVMFSRRSMYSRIKYIVGFRALPAVLSRAGRCASRGDAFFICACPARVLLSLVCKLFRVCQNRIRKDTSVTYQVVVEDLARRMYLGRHSSTVGSNVSIF